MPVTCNMGKTLYRTLFLYIDKYRCDKIMIYQDENGVTKISVRFADEDLWLTQAQLAEIYDTTQQNISQHVDGIYSDGELDREATNKKFLLVLSS